MTLKADKSHQDLLTEKEWDTLYAVYPQGIPVFDLRLQEFAQLSRDPQYLIEGTAVYREYAQQCKCWVCLHMLSLPIITGFHLYIVLINKICAGGEPTYQVN